MSVRVHPSARNGWVMQWLQKRVSQLESDLLPAFLPIGREGRRYRLQIQVAGKAASRRRDVATPPKSCGWVHGDYLLRILVHVRARESPQFRRACSLTCCPAKFHLFPRLISLPLVRKNCLSQSPSSLPLPTLFPPLFVFTRGSL